MAKPLHIVTDIAPVAALVSAVSGEPQFTEQLIPGTVSAHDFALKPSDLHALQTADLIIWMGPLATPGMAKLMTQPEMAAKSLTLEDNISPLFQREAGVFGDASPALKSADPHAWLDPDHGRVWAGLIAEALQSRDLAKAKLYHQQSLQLIADIDRAEAKIFAQLAKPDALPYVQFHDAFQYFEAHFGLSPLGAASSGDHEHTSLGVVTKLRLQLSNSAASCVFVEDKQQAKQAAPLLEVAGSKVGFLDPMGRGVPASEYTYPALLLAIAAGFTACLY